MVSNITVVQISVSTSCQIKTASKILFIEDGNIKPYQQDCALHLKNPVHCTLTFSETQLNMVRESDPMLGLPITLKSSMQGSSVDIVCRYITTRILFPPNHSPVWAALEGNRYELFDIATYKKIYTSLSELQ
jgi:hypothetical protein